MQFRGITHVLPLAIACTVATTATCTAAVIVVANYTPDDVTVSIAEMEGKSRTHKIPAYNVLPIPVAGPADLKFPNADGDAAVRVEPANAYVIVPDRVRKIRIEGIELPGKPPERDARPELNPIPRKPVKIPVTLLVDDVDPRADTFWQTETRKRFEAAAEIIEAETGFRFEFAQFSTWKSNAAAKEVGAQLTAFEEAVKVKPGSIAIGFISRTLNDEPKEYGACRGLGSAHVLVREWKPRSEPERLEVLVRYLAVHLGSITSPDPGSVMRPTIGDGKALRTGFVVRLDPLNVLALNLLADQRRLGINSLQEIAPVDRIRLTRVYSALLQASPQDSLAADYVNILDKDVARGVNPGGKKPAATVGEQAKRTEAIRTVVRAVVDRAKSNTGPTALRGDDLTIALLRAAAEAAQRLDEESRVSAFLLGIGVALDDRNILHDDPLTANAVADVETDAERAERIAVLDNPTLANRRDLCRGFAVGCGSGEVLKPVAAEGYAVGHATFDLIRPNYAAGLSFPALTAELAGVSLARSMRERPDLVFKRLREKFSAADLVPDTRKLPDCVGPGKFEENYGGPSDERFKAILKEMHKRIDVLPVNRTGP